MEKKFVSILANNSSVQKIPSGRVDFTRKAVEAETQPATPERAGCQSKSDKRLLAQREPKRR
jgi:hypothetical protein